MRKERAKDETREILLGCIIVLLIIAVFSLFTKTSHNKYNLVETYLSSDYYSKEHLREAMANQLGESRRFIIDLRDNNGGSTDELIDMLSIFYEEGKEVYSLIENDKVTKSKTKKEKQVDFEKIVFLCNENTASVAEAMIFNMKSDFADKIEIVGQKHMERIFVMHIKNLMMENC